MSFRRAFHSRGESFALVTTRELARDDHRISVNASTAAAMLTPLVRSFFDALELRRIEAELAPAFPSCDDHEMIDRLVAAISTGRLTLVRAAPPRTWGYDGSPTRAKRLDVGQPDRAGPAEDTSHWVELRLVDEDNAGVAGLLYLVITPDGRRYRGYTDSLGEARVTRLPAGPYQVSFPDLDGSVCERTEAS